MRVGAVVCGIRMSSIGGSHLLGGGGDFICSPGATSAWSTAHTPLVGVTFAAGRDGIDMSAAVVDYHGGMVVRAFDG